MYDPNYESQHNDSLVERDQQVGLEPKRTRHDAGTATPTGLNAVPESKRTLIFDGGNLSNGWREIALNTRNEVTGNGAERPWRQIVGLAVSSNQIN